MLDEPQRTQTTLYMTPPIYRIPVEILAKIMVIATKEDASNSLPLVDFCNGPQWILSHVSHRFADVAISTQELWSKIVLNIQGPGHRVIAGPRSTLLVIKRLLPTHVNRAGARSLDISITGIAGDPAAARAALDILWEKQKQWEHIHMENLLDVATVAKLDDLHLANDADFPYLRSINIRLTVEDCAGLRNPQIRASLRFDAPEGRIEVYQKSIAIFRRSPLVESVDLGLSPFFRPGETWQWGNNPVPWRHEARHPICQVHRCRTYYRARECFPISRFSLGHISPRHLHRSSHRAPPNVVP
ncbi:hypothetical protein BDV98DRAFT_575752 [Pterulicium gracile]|uniref:Uncharacterized protein n=1 Tax=Pterulicium gracile TaxID=1884261 RepID=A0A5C3Q3P6_9AGAR|nr:hypothetical protein BDV98DRAFT_575752 [Pterula gracilis]